jgi:hypothetical protein
MNSGRIKRAVVFVGGKNPELLKIKSGFKVVVFECENDVDINMLRKSLGRVLENDNVSVYEYD